MNTDVKAALAQVEKAQKEAENLAKEKLKHEEERTLTHLRDYTSKVNEILAKNGYSQRAFVGKHNGRVDPFITIEGCSPIKVSLYTLSRGQGRPDTEELEYVVLFSSGKHFDDLNEAIVEAYEVYQNAIKNFQVEIL